MAQPKHHNGPPEELDISAMPELRRVAEEVAASGRPRLLTEDGRALAEITPTSRRSVRRRASPAAQRRHFLAAAGSWADVDTDQLLADIYASRDAPGRPPLEL